MTGEARTLRRSGSSQGGRPRKPAAEALSRVVGVRLTPEEHERVCAAAEAAHLKPGPYLRRVALGRVLPPVVPAINRDTYRQLVGACSNWNQALHHLNAGNLSPELAPALDRLVELLGVVQLELTGRGEGR